MYRNYKYIPYGEKCIHNVILLDSFYVNTLLSWILKYVCGARIAHSQRWLTLQSPGVPGSSPAAAEIFPCCTYMQ